MSYEEMTVDELYVELADVREAIGERGTPNSDREYLRQCEADLVALIDAKEGN